MGGRLRRADALRAGRGPGRRGLAAFTYHATIKVPKPFVAFSSGATVRRWEEGELACVELRETNPISSADVIAGKYTTEVDSRPGLTVRVSSYGLAKRGASRQIAGLVHTFAQFYGPLLGKVPFPEIEVLEINSLGFGMAPPGMILITREAFNPLSTTASQAYARGVNSRPAHEVAHAWWGHAVRPALPADRWMSESLAEYYSGLAMQLRNPKELEGMLEEWKRQAKRVQGWGSVLLADQIAGRDAWEDDTALLYAKGPLVLHALRLELGDQAFFTVFKSLVRSFPMKDASTRDVIALTNLVGGRDRAGWFDRFLLGTEWPELEKDR